MRVVYKYPLSGSGDLTTLLLPRGTELLYVGHQDTHPFIWVLMPPGDYALLEERHFRIAGTGHHIEQEIVSHVGSYQIHEWWAIFHVFEVA